MSKANPIFGIDVSGWNDIEITDLPTWVEFVGIKATQADDFVNPLFGRQLRAARTKGKRIILYHFLDSTATAEDQADHFLRTIGTPRGAILAVDFEAYGDWSPSNRQLLNFGRQIEHRTGGAKKLLYSGQGFWEGGDSSGDFGQYGYDVAWDAWYADMALHRDPRGYYQDLVKNNWGWGERWGGVEPEFWQFTSAGFVARRYVDFNAYRGTLADLDALVGSEDSGVPPRPRKPRTTQDDVDLILNYLEKTFGGRYVEWVGGPFGPRAPAWVGKHPAPPPREVKREGAFCAAAITLGLRRLGLPLPIPSDPEWEGGLLDYGNDYIDTLKIAEPYRQGMNVREGDLFLVRYTGPALVDQGHAWIMGRGGKCYQSDMPLGTNGARTLNETINALTHGKQVWIIRRERWMRPTR